MIKLFKLFDKTFCAFLCFFISLFKKKSKKSNSPFEVLNNSNNLLFIKFIAIGDLVVILPLLKTFKDNFPNKKIFFLASTRVKEVLDNQPFIDEIIYYEPSLNFFTLYKLIKKLNKLQITFVFQLDHYYRFPLLIALLAKIPYQIGFNFPIFGKKQMLDFKVPYKIRNHEVDNFLNFARFFNLKLPEPIKLLPLVIKKNDKAKINLILNQNKLLPSSQINKTNLNQSFIIIHPGTSKQAKSRQWSFKNWLSLIQKILADYPYKIIICGGTNEAKLNLNLPSSKKIINLVDQLSLTEFAYLTSLSVLYIGLDTGPTHIAAAMQAKVFALYGPNTPEKWGPFGTQNETIHYALNCSPCIKQYLGKIKNCKNNKCMQGITVEQVLEKFSEMLLH